MDPGPSVSSWPTSSSKDPVPHRQWSEAGAQEPEEGQGQVFLALSFRMRFRLSLCTLGGRRKKSMLALVHGNPGQRGNFRMVRCCQESSSPSHISLYLLLWASCQPPAFIPSSFPPSLFHRPKKKRCHRAECIFILVRCHSNSKATKIVLRQRL